MPHLNFNEKTQYVPAMRTITSSLSGNSGHYNSQASSYDPQTSHNTAQYIQAIFSCMNRNKDENGNGKIDAAELKWYVPAAGKYLRVILGRNNLITPLMGYEQKTLPKDAPMTTIRSTTSYQATERLSGLMKVCRVLSSIPPLILGNMRHGR